MVEIDCLQCGSICQIRFNEDETTEERPLFCPFCSADLEEQEEDDDDESDEDYLEKLNDEDEWN